MADDGRARHPGDEFPVHMTVAAASLEASRDWLQRNLDRIRAALADRGAVLLHDARFRDAAGFARLRTVITGRPIGPREPFVSRGEYGDHVYSAAEWPRGRTMCLHPEQSYLLEVPRTLLFGCLVSAGHDGATLLADNRKVLAELPASLRERFRSTGWLLRRAFREHVGIPWQEAFGTEDRRDAEQYFRGHGIDWHWEADGTLLASVRRAAVVAHPATGEHCWFNHAAFLNRWSLDPVERDILLDAFGADGLPFDTFFGDGKPIDEADVQAINDAYDRCAARVEWLAGDLLLIDNILVSHGREPFTGPRELLISIADPVLCGPVTRRAEYRAEPF